MDVFFIFLLVVLGGVLLFCLFMLSRNEWVYAKRTQMIDDDMASYELLLSYEEMMRRWWVWDIKKLKKDQTALPSETQQAE